MAIAKVEPLTTARALRGPFDYRLPERLGEVGVGSVLLVPFGRRRVIGVVVGVAESSELPPERLAEPIEALAAGATPELVRLGLRVARDYCSTPARGLEAPAAPHGGPGGPRGGTRGSNARRRNRGRPGGAWRRHPALGPRQRRALERLAGERGEEGVELSGRRLAADGVDRATLVRLEARGLVRLRLEQRLRRPRVVEVGARSSRPPLSAEQGAAVEAIVAAIDGGAGREHLLHGVTGSGKTEVYLAATEAALQRGRARSCSSRRSG